MLLGSIEVALKKSEPSFIIEYGCFLSSRAQIPLILILKSPGDEVAAEAKQFDFKEGFEAVDDADEGTALLFRTNGEKLSEEGNYFVQVILS